MHIRIPKILIGSNLEGMILASKMHAVFIPCAFQHSFGWEYYDVELFLLQKIRESFFISKKLAPYEDLLYQISNDGESTYVRTYYWELERFYKWFLFGAGLLYDDFNTSSCILNEINGTKVLSTTSNNGSNLSIEFDQCYIVNPGSHWFTNLINEPKKTNISDECHVLYHLKLRKETDDQKGIQIANDIETIEGYSFNKVWNYKPYGMKKMTIGNNPKLRTETKTSANFTFICENVPCSNLVDSDKYDVHNIRLEMYNYFSKTKNQKRIKERIMTFDKTINKIILSTNVDVYENADNVEYIYFDEREDIICKKYINDQYTQGSSLPTLYQMYNKAFYLLSIGKHLKRILF